MSRTILIGGDRRGGTTLLAMMLDSHSRFCIGTELLFEKLVDLGPAVLRAHEEFCKNPTSANPYVTWIKRVARLGMHPDELMATIRLEMAEHGSEIKSFFQKCALIERIMLTVMGRKPPANRWGFKIMLGIAELSKYHEVWPWTDFVHIIRDGRDVAAANLNFPWGYPTVEICAREWMRHIKNARKEAFSLPQCRYQELRYEDLVRDPAKTLRRLCDTLGVFFEEKMIRFEKEEHSFFENHYDHPSYRQLTQGLNNQYLGKYKRILTPEQIEIFEDIAGKTLRECEYL